MSFAYQAIKAIFRIPRGNVATYGQIAALAGSPRAARMVGWILSQNGEALPWHRVISSRGRISITNLAYPAELQAQLLEKEGVKVDKHGRNYSVDLEEFLWRI